MARFHPHLCFASPESLPTIDPQLLVLVPQKNRTRGRPKGANKEEAGTQATAMATETQGTQDTITHRIVSRFEVALQEGRNRGSSQETTCRQVIPDGQPSAQKPVSEQAREVVGAGATGEGAEGVVVSYQHLSVARLAFDVMVRA